MTRPGLPARLVRARDAAASGDSECPPPILTSPDMTPPSVHVRQWTGVRAAGCAVLVVQVEQVPAVPPQAAVLRPGFLHLVLEVLHTGPQVPQGDPAEAQDGDEDRPHSGEENLLSRHTGVPLGCRGGWVSGAGLWWRHCPWPRVGTVLALAQRP